MRTRSTLLALTTATAVVALAGLAAGGTASAAPGLGLTPVPTANPKAPGLTTPNTLSRELNQVIRAQGSSLLENPAAGIGYYGYDSINNTPPLLAVGGTPEAHKTEPDKNTYLVLKGQTGPDAAYDYGTHFLFQGHESSDAGSSGYVTRINLDADAAHRVTLLATNDQVGKLPNFDGSTYNPFTGTLMLTAEAGCKTTAGVWQGNPGYAANRRFESLQGELGLGGYEGIQTASDGSIWLVEDVGGSSFGPPNTPDAPRKAKVPNSFVYRFVPVDKSDLTKGGKLQALQAKGSTGPITYDATDPFTQNIENLHTYGKTFSTTWVTVHDTATDGATSFCAGDLAKTAGATPFKRPENGVFRPGTGFGEFYFTETGDTDTRSAANGQYGGFGGVFKLVQNGPTADAGTLTLAYKGDLAHTGLDNIQFLTKDQLAVVEDAGDTLHEQRNALDSGYLLDVTQQQPAPLRFLAEGRDPSATLDSALDNTLSSGNDGDNEITGIHVSDGDPTVSGLLGAKTPKPFKAGWRAFYTAQHGDNVTFEIVPNPIAGPYNNNKDNKNNGTEDKD